MNDPEFDPYRPPTASIAIEREVTASGHAVVPDGSPFLTIWLKPRGTIRGIVDRDPGRHVLWLSMVWGVAESLSFSANGNLGDKYPLMPILGGSLAAGIVAGPLLNVIFAALLTWVGGWLGGRGKPIQLRAAFAWSYITETPIVLLWMGVLSIFGIRFFQEAGLDDPTEVEAILLIAFPICTISLLIWSFVILIKTVAEVHEFSAWKALGTILICAGFGIVLLFFVGVAVGIATMK
jgi:hypothetical protein